MSQAVGPAKLHAWITMEFANILHGKKRRALFEELDKRAESNIIPNNLSNEERILRASQIAYPNDKRMRRKYLKKLLKDWEKTAAI